MSEKVEKKTGFGWRLVSKVFAGVSGLSIVASCLFGWSNDLILKLPEIIVSILGNTVLNIAFEFIGYGLLIYAMSSSCWDFKKEDDKVKFWTSAATVGSCIFMYTVCRILKNSIALPSIGSQGTSLGKLVVGVTAVAYGLYMTWLNKRFSIKRLLPMLVAPIIAYFLFFFLLIKADLYDVVVPGAGFSQWYEGLLGGVLNRIVHSSVIANWPKFIFFVLSETFAVPMISAGYQVFNMNVDKKSSKRLLIPLLIFSQFVTMLAGFIFETSGTGGGSIGYVTQYMSDVGTGNRVACDSLANTVNWTGKKAAKANNNDVAIAVILVSTVVLFLSNYILFMNYEEKEGSHAGGSSKKSAKVPMSVALKMMAQNKIVLSFVLMAILFGICSSFIEQCWQISLKNICDSMINYYYPTEVDALKAADLINNNELGKKVIIEAGTSLYRPLYSTYIIFQGRVTMLLLVGTTRFLSKRLSWFTFSAILPVVLSILSILYFGMLAFGGASATLFGANILPVVVILGTIVLLFAKSFKVSAGDYNRESAQSHYPDETKKEIKSAEATFSRMGKTTTSVVFYILANILSIPNYLDYRVAMVLLVFSIVSGYYWFKSIADIATDLEEMDAKEAEQKKILHEEKK